jgi:thiamine-phosphate pyrophosphorylase
MPRPFKLYYITDRRGLEGAALPGHLREAVDAHVDIIQIRERDLGSRDLVNLVENAVSYARATGTLITVNDRLDIALAIGAAGVHLGTHSMPAARVRAVIPKGFLMGVSCHSIEDVLRAESAGADYVLLGPIFETPSKLAYGPPLGLSMLSEATARTTIPVFALGGITVDRAMQCLGAGAAGLAGIRIFQDPASLRSCVHQLRAQVTSAES